ncbi:MAG: portal protein, partial [Phycisphaerae bacterium]
MTKEQEQKILREAQDRLRKAIDEDDENRKLAKEDLEFIAVDGKQWPEGVKAEREAEGRPCLTINKMPTFVDQVVGDQRMNRPSIKVIPVDAEAKMKTAEILGGWIKHVQQISKSDVAIDHGFEHAVACGYGAWRVVTKYTSDSAFEQEAYIEKIDNALSVFWGRH